MNVTLYKNTSERERVVKNLTSPVIMSGTLRGECSVLEPEILVDKSQNLALYNYMYIPDFGRYYYCKIESVNNRMWRVIGKVDVLMSYASQIKAQTAIVERQENNWDLYLPDEAFRTSQKEQVQTKNFPNKFDNNPHYVLVIAGKPKEVTTNDAT